MMLRRVRKAICRLCDSANAGPAAAILSRIRSMLAFCLLDDLIIIVAIALASMDDSVPAYLSSAEEATTPARGMVFQDLWETPKSNVPTIRRHQFRDSILCLLSFSFDSPILGYMR